MLFHPAQLHIHCTCILVHLGKTWDKKKGQVYNIRSIYYVACLEGYFHLHHDPNEAARVWQAELQ